MPTAFEKSGLFPINEEKVRERLPTVTNSAEITTNLDQTLLRKLEANRYGDQSKKQNKARPKGKGIPAGTSYMPDDDDSSDSSESTEQAESSDEEAEDTVPPRPEALSESIRNLLVSSRAKSKPKPAKSAPTKSSHLVAGQFVAAVYESERFLAEVSGNQSEVAKG